MLTSHPRGNTTTPILPVNSSHLPPTTKQLPYPSLCLPGTGLSAGRVLPYPSAIGSLDIRILFAPEAPGRLSKN
ncbi:MAG: hypothetical protein ACLUVG_06905 [Phocaeicola vulgatus]